MLITASKNFPAGNLKDAIAWLTARPDKAVVGTAGVSGASHLAGVFFETSTRLRFVRYRGVGAATQDMLAGRVDLMFDFVANALPQLRAGKLQAFAVMSRLRIG